MWLIIGITSLFLGTGIAHERQNDLSNDLTEEVIFTNARVFITISSLTSQNKKTKVVSERKIELNWYNLEIELAKDAAVWIGLFNSEPNNDLSKPLAKKVVSGNVEGSFMTTVSYPYYNIGLPNETNRCFDYWVGLVYKDQVLVKDCHGVKPNWMYELRDIIGRKTLLDLMIPGTHNAGSYMIYDPNNDNLKTRYQMCQDENLWNQLMYGIRFLDLRVLYRTVTDSPEVYWISHNIFRTNITIKHVLDTVKRFLDLTNEIVIIDFHEFQFGFNDKYINNNHRQFMKMLIEELEDYAIPRNYGYKQTLNELWKKKKRLIVGYASHHGEESTMFFPGISHLWPNVDNITKLKEFFEDYVCHQHKYSLWSAMAEFTATGWGIAFDTYGGLRKMAQDVNLEITRWFRDLWWNCASIVSTDYFLGNDIINVAIETNKRKWEK